MRVNRPDFPLWVTVECAAAAAQGDLDEVRVGLATLAHQGYRFERDFTWSALAAMTVQAAWAVRDTTAAEALYAQLAPYSGLMTWNGAATHGPIDAALALGASLLGRRADARGHLAIADSLTTKIGAAHLRWAALDQLA